MPISFTCASCGAKINAPDSAAGKKSKCPKCSGQVVVPGEPDSKKCIDVVEPPPAPQIIYPSPVAIPYTPEPLPQAVLRKECMACGEMVLEQARICKHCGLDPDEVPRRRSRDRDDRDRGTTIVVNNEVRQESRYYRERRSFPHGTHFLMTIVTCGLWLPIWIIAWAMSGR